MRPLVYAVAAGIVIGAVGANTYGAVFSDTLSRADHMATEVAEIDHHVTALKAKDAKLSTGEHDLAQYSITTSQQAVQQAIDADLGRIRTDQTFASTLQREAPHPPVPAALFDYIPGLLPFAGVICWTIGKTIYNERPGKNSQQRSEPPVERL